MTTSPTLLNLLLERGFGGPSPLLGMPRRFEWRAAGKLNFLLGYGDLLKDGGLARVILGRGGDDVPNVTFLSAEMTLLSMKVSLGWPGMEKSQSQSIIFIVA